MRTSEYLTVGNIYTRKQLSELFKIRDASLNNGVFRPKGHDSVWLFVSERKTPDREQYADMLIGNLLYWDGQLQGKTNHLIERHKQSNLEILVFYRQSRSEHPGSGFLYEGEFEYYSHHGQYPTHFLLHRKMSILELSTYDADELSSEAEYHEGEKRSRFTSYYERDPQLRAATIELYGTTCMACGFDFEKTYGAYGKGFIEVHHTKPVSELGGMTSVNPETDMAVVCANCHRMLHRSRKHVLSIEELQSMMQRTKLL